MNASCKLIIKCVTTDAAEHDSNAVARLVDDGDCCQQCYADSAYIGGWVQRSLRKQGVETCIVKRREKGQDLSKDKRP